MPSFDDLKLSRPTLRSLKELGFEEPTPVQTSAIPPLMAGRDVVAQALTGTGKTAAYGIPLVERLNIRLQRPQALVLAPTRELAIQVAEHVEQLGRHLGVRLLPIYGGQAIEHQLRALRRGVHAIVATPGRLMDHIRRGTIDLSQIQLLVLDEADQMLQMGFQEDVEYVISQLPAARQTALFSATMPQPILKIVNNYMRQPELIHLSKPQALTVPSVKQIYFQVPFPRKFDALCRVMDARSADRVLVFCSTKRMVDEVAERLPAFGYMADALHGDVSQAGRERVLKSFRDGRVEVLVATDVAARGLDVPDVSLVINFDIPPDPEYYVHRIGRTARSGRSGEAITFVNPREMRELEAIERVTGARILRGQLPTPAETQERKAVALGDNLRSMLDGGEWKGHRSLIEELSLNYDPLDVAAAALALLSLEGGGPAVRRHRFSSVPRPADQGEPAMEPPASPEPPGQTRSRPPPSRPSRPHRVEHARPTPNKSAPKGARSKGLKSRPGSRPRKR